MRFCVTGLLSFNVFMMKKHNIYKCYSLLFYVLVCYFCMGKQLLYSLKYLHYHTTFLWIKNEPTEPQQTETNGLTGVY